MNSIVIKQNQFDIEPYTLILANRNLEHIGQIKNLTEVHFSPHLNSANELSFTAHWNEQQLLEDYKSDLSSGELTQEQVDKFILADKNIWNQLIDFKLVWIKELDEYYEIKIQYVDSKRITKVVTCTALCESELSQYNLYGLEINTEADIAREDYEPTPFCNFENHKASLLHRVLKDKAPHYTIKHVDKSLLNLQRAFTIDGTSIYDFFTGECSEQFHCLFDFDSSDRSISVYDLYSVCDDCGHRGDFIDVCPECGGTSISYFGEDTSILINKDNLTSEIQLEGDTDSVKNCFKLEAGDDVITSTVRALNPNGTDYIYKIPDWQLADMPQSLVDKITEYDALYALYTEEFTQLTSDIYDVVDRILYYESEMMPSIENSKVTAQTEADKLIVDNLSPLAVAELSSSTSTETVNSALKNYARVYVKTGYVKLEINSGSFTYLGTNTSGNNYGEWTGNFKVTNYSDDTDVAYSSTVTITINDDYPTFVEQKILKSFDTSKEESIFDVLSIQDLAEFQSALTYYGLNRLTSFADAIQGALDVLVYENQGSKNSELYNVLYEPYYNKLVACQGEIDTRQNTLDALNAEYDALETRRLEIQDILNFEQFLDDQYLIFCAYRREDVYSNSNYISDGLSNTEIIECAERFISTAKRELDKASTINYTISTTLENLALIPEFAPLLDKFALGNWIRIEVGREIYRLRLLDYSLDFSNLKTIPVDFSTVAKIRTIANDMQDIITSAKSMSSSYAYVSKQAEKGTQAQNTIKDWVSEGWNSALVQIKNNDWEETTMDSHGILCRSRDDLTEQYKPEQLRITSNILAYTDDNWKSVKNALGKHNYVYFDKNSNSFSNATGYGLTTEFVQSGWVYGSQIISGEVYSENYSPTMGKGAHIDLNNGSFTLADSKIVYDADTSKLTLKGIDIDWSTSSTPEVGDIDGLGTALDSRPTNEQMNAAISLSEEGIISTVSQSYATQEQLNNLQQQIDGAIESFTGNEMPTLENEPAVEWTTDELKDSHVGDLYIVGSEGGDYAGFYYRFEKLNGVYQWVLLQDNEIAKALEEARKANEAAQAVADDLATNYSTTSQMNSAIEQQANAINLSVDEKVGTTKTYADTVASNAVDSANTSTDEKLKSYSTTEEMNSAISVSAKNINLSVDEKIAETETYAQEVANVAESNAISSANDTTDEKLKSYTNTTDMNAAITLASDEVLTSVSKTYETKTEAETTKTSLEAQIKLNADNINLKVSSDDLVNELNNQIDIGTEAITISGNKLIVDSDNLQVAEDGTLTATNGVFKGQITATSGIIGLNADYGFTITSNAIYNGTNSMTSTNPGIYLGRNGIRLYGSETAKVTISGGQLNAVGATISGHLTATGGTIGGWTLNSTAIYRGSATYGASGGMYFGASGLSIGSTFKVSSAGVVTCSGANISGVVALAKGSSIGGMKADSNSIFGNGKEITDANPRWSSITKGFAFMCPGGTSTKISLGNSSEMSGWVFGCYPHFGVTSEGNIYGTKAYFNSVKDDGAEIRIIDENTNSITFKGDSIEMSYTGHNSELRATGLYFPSVTIDGVVGELTIGGQTLTESDLEKLLELI